MKKKKEEPQAVEPTPQNSEVKVEQKKEVELAKETTLKRADAKKPSAVAITKTTPKPAIKKVEDVTSDVSNNEEDETNTSGRIIPKRRGLKIVKRNNLKKNKKRSKKSIPLLVHLIAVKQYQVRKK